MAIHGSSSTVLLTISGPAGFELTGAVIQIHGTRKMSEDKEPFKIPFRGIPVAYHSVECVCVCVCVSLFFCLKCSCFVNSHELPCVNHPTATRFVPVNMAILDSTMANGNHLSASQIRNLKKHPLERVSLDQISMKPMDLR